MFHETHVEGAIRDAVGCVARCPIIYPTIRLYSVRVHTGHDAFSARVLLVHFMVPWRELLHYGWLVVHFLSHLP
jgi:hypothetical protein